MFSALYRARIDDGNLMFATGEAIAHLNYLINERLVGVDTGNDGVSWYRRL